jgi:hypothetical protein
LEKEKVVPQRELRRQIEGLEEATTSDLLRLVFDLRAYPSNHHMHVAGRHGSSLG